jgi:hypothetical protein
MSKQKVIARQFMDFLKKPETVSMLQSYGLAPPLAAGR